MESSEYANTNVNVDPDLQSPATQNEITYNLDTNEITYNLDTKDHYETEGYARFDSFYSTERIEQLNSIIDDLSVSLGVCDTVFDEDGTGKLKQIQYLHRHHEEFQKLVNDLRPFAEFLSGSSDLNLLNVQLFEKHNDISKPTRAHQDNAYFKIDPPTALTFWLSLDDVDEENGCLYYAPKTHLTPTRKHQRYHPHTTFRMRSGVPGLSLCLHEHPEETDIPIYTKKGDLLVHNCNLVHRAGNNTSKDRRRRAIGVVFIPANCVENPLLVKYHNDRLREDIELQKVKDPARYRELREQFDYLFN